MKLVIWNAEGALARELKTLGHHSSPGRIKDVEVFRKLVASEPSSFVLLWHTWQKDAFPILRKVSTNWPSRLEGCVLFSSGKYANGSREKADAFLRQNPDLRRKVHVCSSFVSSDEPEPAVVGRLKTFGECISKLDVGTPVPFELVEPPPPKRMLFTAQMACLVDSVSDEDVTTLIEKCLDWPSLSEALAKPVTHASLRRIVNAQSDEMECPLCQYRITITHPLKPTGNPIPILQGEGAMTLRTLLEIDPADKLARVVRSSLVMSRTCSQNKFANKAVEALESIFKEGCALFCKREKLTELRDQVEALLAQEADREAFRPVVVQIKSTLSCPSVINVHNKIRLQERLRKR